MTPFLTASEIGAYVFCPEAWYLQRHRVVRSPLATERLLDGVLAHQHIGRQTDRLQRAERKGRRLLFAIIVRLSLLVIVISVGFPARP